MTQIRSSAPRILGFACGPCCCRVANRIVMPKSTTFTRVLTNQLSQELKKLLKDADVRITKKAEEACLYKLKQHAMKKCGEQARAYAQCCEGRSFSMVWACKPALNELNQCLKECTQTHVQQQLFQRYADAGHPERPDWDKLLEGL